MSNKNKSVEEVAGELWRCIKEDFEKEGLTLPDSWKGIGMAYGGYSRACEIIQQERQTSQEREREMIEELIEFTFEACPYEGTMMRAFLNNYKTTKITNPNKD